MCNVYLSVVWHLTICKETWADEGKFSRVKLFGKWVDASIAAAAPRTQFADAAAYASNFLKSKFQWQSRLGGIILVCSREILTLNKNSIVIKLRLIPNLFPT